MNPAEMLLEKMKRRNTNERNQNLIAIPTTGKIAAPLSPFNIHKETVIPRKVSAVDSQPPDLNSIKPLKILLTKDYKYEAGDSAPSSVVSDILSSIKSTSSPNDSVLSKMGESSVSPSFVFDNVQINDRNRKVSSSSKAIDLDWEPGLFRFPDESEVEDFSNPFYNQLRKNALDSMNAEIDCPLIPPYELLDILRFD